MSIQFTNFREEDIIYKKGIGKFFESNITVNYKSNTVWDLFKDTRNTWLWHPHMYLVDYPIANSANRSFLITDIKILILVLDQYQ